MADAKKCDNCGVYYTEDSKEEENRPELHVRTGDLFCNSRKGPFTYILLCTSNRYGPIEKRKDLCGRCAKLYFDKLGGSSKED